MTRLTDRIARALIALHPPAWRRRYAPEVDALVGAAPVTMASITDLTRSLIGEWRLAWWRSATSQTGWPGVGQAANLILITMATFLAVKLALALAEAAVLTGLFLAVRGELVARFVVRLWASGRGSGTTIAPIGFFLFFLVWWFGPAAAAAALLGLIRAGRLSPLACRALTACAYASISLWLFDWQMQVASLGAGWVFASALFPTRPVRSTPGGVGALRSDAASLDVRSSEGPRHSDDAWLTSRLRQRALGAVTA